MSSTNVAKGIKWIDERLIGVDSVMPSEISKDGKTQGQLNIMPGICKKVIKGPADNSIYTPNDDEDSIAQKMEAQGVEWMKANKNPGSRINGASLFVDMLEAVIEGKKQSQACQKNPLSMYLIIAEGGLAVYLF